MKKLFAILLVAFLATTFVKAQFGPMEGYYCHDEATGKFLFHVEKAISITPEYQEVDLGGLCPGCFHEWPNQGRENCLEWTITGGHICWFNIGHDNPDWYYNVEVIQRWWEQDYNTDFGWVLFDDVDKLMGDKGWGLRKCIDKLTANCLAEEGPYSVVYTVWVDYVCHAQ